MTKRETQKAAAAGRGASPATADTTTQLAQLLPELAVALYESAPHHEAVVFLAHRGEVTMGEFAAGLEISRAAASELVARLLDKGVILRETGAGDRRVVRVRLAGRAEGYADDMLRQWRAQLTKVFARFPDIDPDILVAFLRDLIVQLKGQPPA